MSDREFWIETLHDEVRYSRENKLCSHGVPPANCEHHKPSREDA